jgi:hypothetical protein
LPAAVINRMPPSPLVLRVAHKAPHLIDFGFVDPMDHDVHIARIDGT